MTQTIWADATELTVVRCWCGVQHAIPSTMRSEQLRAHDEGRSVTAYCPVGHQHSPAGRSRAQQLRDDLARERAQHDQTRAELEHTEARRRAEKAAKTKLKKRAAAGVCPCCSRTFQNLAQHMKTKHPDFAE